MNLINTLPLFFKDYGSDAPIGIIAVVLTVIVYIIWLAIEPDSATKSIQSGGLAYGEKGVNNAKNRRKAKKRRDNQIGRMRAITEPNIDGQYLYIFEANGLHKVGISNNPESRSNQIRKRLNSPVSIIYIGNVRYGRTIDAETLVHRDLSEYNVPIDYNDGSTSPEWFNCSIGKVLSTCEKYADMN